MTTTEKLEQATLEFKEGMIELRESQSDTDERVKKMSEKVEETTDGIKDMKDGITEMKEGIKDMRDGITEMKDGLKETKDNVDRMSKKVEETTESLKRIGIHLGGISNNMGDSAEEFFFNSIDITKKLGGIQYDEKYSNLTDKLSKIDDEFDIVLFNGSEIALIEVKYKVHLKNIGKLLDKKIDNFKRMYPKYKDYSYHLGFASFNINNDVKKEALENNIMILQRKGDVLETLISSS